MGIDLTVLLIIASLYLMRHCSRASPHTCQVTSELTYCMGCAFSLSVLAAGDGQDCRAR